MIRQLADEVQNKVIRLRMKIKKTLQRQTVIWKRKGMVAVTFRDVAIFGLMKFQELALL